MSLVIQNPGEGCRAFVWSLQEIPPQAGLSFRLGGLEGLFQPPQLFDSHSDPSGAKLTFMVLLFAWRTKASAPIVTPRSFGELRHREVARSGGEVRSRGAAMRSSGEEQR